MTREEAIDIIKCLAWHTRPNEEDIEQAIKTLKQEPCEDAISRQEVLDEINRVGVKGFETYNDYSQLFDFVDTLPPVTAESKTGQCKDCKYFEYNSVAKSQRESCKDEDSVTSKPKMGKWENISNGIEYDWGTCNKCKARIPMAYKYYNYCPNCGCRMVEPQEFEQKCYVVDNQYIIGYHDGLRDAIKAIEDKAESEGKK